VRPFPKTNAEVLKFLLHKYAVEEKYLVKLVAVRGFYPVLPGPLGNSRGTYDDACFVIHPEGIESYNFNTDPSTSRPGMASLVEGLYYYMPGLHKGQYAAFRQYSKVTVKRDQGREERGFFGINLHKGGATNTWSEGCQTWPNDQWETAKNLIYEKLLLNRMSIFPYLLVDGIEYYSIEKRLEDK
jgi:hypothetical protein